MRGKFEQGVFLAGLAMLVGAFGVLSCGDGGGGGGASANPPVQSQEPVIRRHVFLKDSYVVKRFVPPPPPQEPIVNVFWFAEVFFEPRPDERILQIWAEGEGAFTGSHQWRIELLDASTFEQSLGLWPIGSAGDGFFPSGGTGFRMMMDVPVGWPYINVQNPIAPPYPFPSTRYVIRAGFSNPSQLYDLYLWNLKLVVITMKEGELLSPSPQLVELDWTKYATR